MVIPESFVVVLLGGAFVFSGLSHYRAIAAPDASPVTLPFWIGLAALLLVFAYLITGVAWPDWAWRGPLFLALGLLLFLGAFARLLHGRVKAQG